MNRVCEPELMLSPAQAAAYSRADLSDLHAAVPALFAQRFGAPSGVLLDLGCGAADMSIRFARAFPPIAVVGVDGSQAMLAEGRRAIDGAGLAGRIALEERRLPDAELETRGYDAVIANSVLHHVSDPIAFWRFVQRCARPDAPVMVVDLRRPADAASARQLVETHSADADPVVQEDFFNSLCAAYTVAEVASQLHAAGLAAFSVDAFGPLQLIAWGRA